MKPFKFVLAACLLLCAIAAAPGVAQDGTWPSKPIRLIVPGSGGGVVDIRARWVAERIGAALGQPIIVELRAGAGGIIGTEAAAKSAPDGYTLLMVHQGTLAINPHLYAKLPYDALADFAPITQIGVGALMLAVNPALPVNSVADLVRLARESPGQLGYGSPGVGTPPHLAVELFRRAAGIDVTHVPYKGGAQSAADLIAGHLAFSIEGFNVQLPHVKAGRMRPLGVTSRTRVAALPDVPAIAETLPGYEFEGWVGIAAPAGTPKAIVEKIYAAVVGATKSSEGRAWFASFNQEPGGDPPDAFAAIVRAEHAKWGKVIRDAGIKFE